MMTTKKRNNRDSVALHNLYVADDSGSNSITMKFRVRSDITDSTAVGDPICNSGVIASNR